MAPADIICISIKTGNTSATPASAIGAELADEISLDQPDRGLRQHHQHVRRGEPDQRRRDRSLDQRAGARVVARSFGRRAAIASGSGAAECSGRTFGRSAGDGRTASLKPAAYRSICTYIKRHGVLGTTMAEVSTNPASCNCLALRQAARHVTQFYDQFLAPSGLRATQYSILARLQRKGSMTINALAAELVMDRTTLGRNILPLATRRPDCGRHGKIRPPQQGIAPDAMPASPASRPRRKAWQKAQVRFETAFGAERAKALRAMLHAVATGDTQGNRAQA